MALDLPHIEGFISPDFASHKKNHRHLIRQSLFQKMFQLTNKPFYEGLNILKPPLKFKNYFISISHSKKIGGYVIAPNQSIGFDIEETSRCKKHLYEKIISKEKEQQTEVSILWTLKEASVKSLSFLQEKIFIRDIEVKNNECSKTFHVRFKNFRGKGFIQKNSLFTMALVKIL